MSPSEVPDSGGSIRVLFFAPVLSGGGAEMQVVRIVNELSVHGVTSRVAVARGGGKYQARVSSEVQVVPCQSVTNSSSFGVAAAIPRLARAIAEFRPDVVCSLQEHTSAALCAAVQLVTVRPAMAFGIQNNFSARVATEPWWARWLLHPGYRRAYRKADSVIANSRGVADDLARQVPAVRSKISVVYNAGVDDGLAALAAAPLPRERPLDPLIVTCGRLTAQKDQRTLLEALALLSDPRPRLWILGDGEERGALEELSRKLGIGARVAFLGFQQNPYPFMAAADVFALSSRWEGFGNVVVEALACGTPVVSSDCPYGPSEILDGGRYGRLFPVGDAAALAAALEATLSEPKSDELTGRLRSRAHEFSARTSAAGYAKIFRQMAGARRSIGSRESDSLMTGATPRGG